MPVTVRIVYRSIYEYMDVVTLNDNTVRAFPRREPWQEPLEAGLETRPPGRYWFYRDRWGNPVARVRITVPHREVEITAASTARLVERYANPPRSRPPLPLPRGSIPPEARLFLAPSPLADHRGLEGLAREVAGGAGDAVEAARRLNSWVYREIRYERGHTDVTTTAREVAELRVGVCQDKAHLLIALLRAIGVPARYVSGALTDTPGETHAWVEAYLPGTGWTPLDPTHDRAFDLGYYYVKFAHGRDYKDVPPINGYFISRAPGRIKLVRVEPEIIEGSLDEGK